MTIKFRIWDGFEMNYEGMMLPISGIRNPKLILQQFTGFNDRYGHEIFEGDVLKILKEGGDELLVTVARDKENSGFTTIPNVLNVHFSKDTCKDFAVVANIFQNEEDFRPYLNLDKDVK